MSELRPAYAGIGSRKTPDDVLDLMCEIATVLEQRGFVLRSGGAPGADQAFLSGVTNARNAETYLPWGSFERAALTTILHSRDHVVLEQAAAWAHPLTAMHHPNWAACNEKARLFHARNVHQVLGPKEYVRDGRIAFDKSKFVICWTSDGEDTGGTGQAIRIANAYQVPVFNLFKPEHRARLEAMLHEAYADKED